jgi:tetratricopeptide (TPR) repeat protein
MLSEEALVIAAAFGACGLLILGVLELLWPTQPRRPARPRPRAARPVAVVSTPPAASLPAVVAPALVVPIRVAEPLPDVAPAMAVAHAPRIHRVSALIRHKREPGRRPYVRREAAALLEAAAPDVAPAAHVEVAAWMGPESVVERCFALHEARRDAEVVVLGLSALQGDDGTDRLGDAETAALWSVIALARQALGEEAEARAALESAIAAAPASARLTYQRQLSALADGVAGGLLAEADRHSGPESEERLTAIRSAVTWLLCGAAAMPADTRLADLAASAEAMLWAAYERTVMACAQRQDFRAARRLLREALADPRFPADRVAGFHELFSGTFNGEIGQLTVQAIRSVQDAREVDALRALQRAETLMGTLSDDVLSPKRREEVNRRLWWGYSKLGERRLGVGEYDAALEALFHAFGYDVGPEPREETHALLVRALDGVTESRALGIRELAEAGDREAALVHCDRLWALLHDAADRGLTDDDLARASVKVQRLFESLGEAVRPRR